MRYAVRWLVNESGLRFLMRRKAACAVAVVTMALALGANTLVFSVARAFMAASLAVPDPERVFVITPVRELPGRGSVVFSEAYPNYKLVRETQRSFADVGVFVQTIASWEDRGEARALRAARVTASFFSTLRVQPIRGRTFTAQEEGPNPAPVAMISHGLWRGALGGDPGVVGRAMQINGTTLTVIGVMPPDFAHPLPTEIWLPFDIPKQAWTAITGARNLGVYGRLASGATAASAKAEMAELTKRSLEASPDNKDFRYDLQTIRQVLLPTAGRTILMMRAGAFLLVFLAVSNLVSLLIAWGFERKQELSVRLALGAHNSRIVRMLVLQSVAVVTLGGLLGVAVAAAALPALRSLDVTPTLALFFAHLDLDPRVLLASALAIAVSGIVAGVVPAWFAARTVLADSLRTASRSATLSVSAIRWQKSMVFLQAGLSVVIVCTASLIGVSFRNLAQVPDGFSPVNRVVARVQLPNPQYGQHPVRAAFADRLIANLGNEREIASFGFTSTLPVGDNLNGGRFFLEQSDGIPSAEALLLHIRRVSPGYLAAMTIPLLRGRQFEARDDSAHTNVAIVSQATARRLWPGEDALGKTFYRVLVNAAPARLEVVGVVGDVMDAGYNVPPGEAVYLPWAQLSAPQMSIVLEPLRDADEAVLALRRALRASDPVIAASDVTTLAALVNQANALPRLQTILLLSFALVAISMVVLGCYGVMTQLVTSREREFALRMLFGAAPAQLGSNVLLQAGRLTTGGAVLGVGAMWLLSGALQPLVFGVAPRSGPVLLAASVLVLVLAGIAAVPPTLRAMRVDARRI